MLGSNSVPRTAFVLEPGFYGPVCLKQEWSAESACYRLSEVSPRFAVLSAYRDIEEALKALGAWPGGHTGVWCVRSWDDRRFTHELLRVLTLCADRLLPIGTHAAYPDQFGDEEDDDVLARRAQARERGAAPRALPTMPQRLKERSWIGKLWSAVLPVRAAGEQQKLFG